MLKYANDEVLKNSSSGGAFSALSDYILKNNGIIYGAVYDYDNNRVVHLRANNFDERNRMRGSKYLQSIVGDSFENVKEDLNADKTVLFTGTICQIAGLRQYLNLKKVNADKLFTCDIICHGVASPLIWKEFIEYKVPGRLCSINFRDKELGWNNSKAIAQREENRIDLSEYMKLFYSHSIMRPSCHTCQFTSTIRCSEITIGDFWGIENLHDCFDSVNGASFVMVNNDKGKNLLKRVLDTNVEIEYKKVQVSDVRQPNLYSPTKASVIRSYFWKDYRNNGIRYVVTKYTSNSILKKMRVIFIKIFCSFSKMFSDMKR